MSEFSMVFDEEHRKAVRDAEMRVVEAAMAVFDPRKERDIAHGVAATDMLREAARALHSLRAAEKKNTGADVDLEASPASSDAKISGSIPGHEASAPASDFDKRVWKDLGPSPGTEAHGQPGVSLPGMDWPGFSPPLTEMRVRELVESNPYVQSLEQSIMDQNARLTALERARDAEPDHCPHGVGRGTRCFVCQRPQPGEIYTGPDRRTPTLEKRVAALEEFVREYKRNTDPSDVHIPPASSSLAGHTAPSLAGRDAGEWSEEQRFAGKAVWASAGGNYDSDAVCAEIAKHAHLWITERMAACGYCDWRTNASTNEESDAAGIEHMRICPSHPMRALERENEALRENYAPTADAAQELGELYSDMAGLSHAHVIGRAIADLKKMRALEAENAELKKKLATVEDDGHDFSVLREERETVIRERDELLENEKILKKQIHKMREADHEIRAHVNVCEKLIAEQGSKLTALRSELATLRSQPSGAGNGHRLRRNTTQSALARRRDPQGVPQAAREAQGEGEANQQGEIMNIEDIARVSHEVNRAYCEALGDKSQVAWEDAPAWQRESALSGVRFHMENPNASASASHESWLEEKRRGGWKYGPVKDAAKKEHPCFVDFDALPREQQAKDFLFRAVVHALARHL